MINLNILVADDSVLMRRNLKNILKQAGYNIVAEASNGKEAVELYRKHQPNLVTMDITMPVMTGIEAVKSIIDEYPDANIIMISALDQKHMVFKALECGAKHYIVKPFKVSAVLKAIQHVLNPDKKQDALSKKSEEVKETKKSEESSMMPYKVSNTDGVFYISIFSTLNNRQYLQLEGTVQGLLSMPNVHIYFDLSGCDYPDEMSFALKPLVDKIKNSGGNTKFLK
ncbi:MAG: response regulator [Thermotogota bacterium]